MHFHGQRLERVSQIGQRIADAVRSPFRSETPKIALLTDFGTGDEAVYAIKSSARRVVGNKRPVVIDDICHNVPFGNILVGAWRLQRAVTLDTELPGTVYVGVVDPGVGTSRKSIIVQTKSGKYLVGPDNGVLSLAFDAEGITRAVSIENKDLTLLKFAQSSTFHGKDVFAPVAAHLTRGVRIEKFGSEISEADLVRIKLSCAATGNTRCGHVVDVDPFGNVRTTMPNHVPLHALGKHAKYRITNGGNNVDEGQARIVRTFGDARPGDELLFVLSSTGCLDLAVNCGNAAKRLGIELDRISLDAKREPTHDVLVEFAAAYGDRNALEDMAK